VRVENSHPQLEWLADPFVLAPILTLAAVYAMRFRTARKEAGGRGTSPLRALAFTAGLLVLTVALVTPLDGLGDRYLFSAHMLQHVLLGDVAPLLLLLGLSRVIMRPATRRLQRVERALGPFAHPLTGLVLWLAVMYLWHIPVMYEAALESPLVHLVEHASFFAAGLAVWWPLIQPVPMRTRLTGMWPVAYIGAAKFGLATLGLYLTWSSGVLYETYEQAPRIWGLSAQTDQNAGGAIMMVEQSVTFVIALVVLFSVALKQSETDQRRRERLEDAAAA
jgi:cytochrome c oxidase assembly factor CtaG